MAIFDKKDLEEMLNEVISELSKKPGKKKIIFVDASSDTTVPAGSSEIITIQPPEGKIWRSLQLYYKAPALSSATTGQHILLFYFESFLPYDFPYVLSDYNKDIEIRTYPLDYSSIVPAIGMSEFGWWTQSLKFSYNYPLNLKYQNSTDADQTNERTIKLLIEEEDEAQ